MYVIVGLGNPEEDYAGTRHNMGFDVINEIAKQYGISMNKNKFKALYAHERIEDEDVILLKPQTFMNSSGESVIECKRFYKLENDRIIIITDDIDLKSGTIRIRKRGSAGTHNGLKSVVHMLNSEDFIRVRVGVGKPKENVDLIEHVIGAIEEDEREELDKGIQKAKEAIIEIIKSGVDNAMNRYN